MKTQSGSPELGSGSLELGSLVAGAWFMDRRVRHDLGRREARFVGQQLVGRRELRFVGRREPISHWVFFVGRWVFVFEK